MSFDGTTYSHPVVWKTMIDHASDLLVYSPPLEGARRYDLLFKGKVDNTKLRSIFYVMAQETMGDFYSSSALYTAYCRRSLVVCQSMLDKEVTERLLEFNETNRSKSFFTAFDNMCRRMFAKVLVQMNDHNKPIIPIECFDTYVDLAEDCFPRLWRHLCGLRDIHSNKTAKAKRLIRSKKRQVLLQLFALRRMRNPQSLKWWSLIQSVAYYG